ncbi:hypothetical protein SB724_21305, partial [Bacillus sp. SIMBA_031]|uniref:hypothetical protein n=1 Tax=Bacillus sp. SIMBA_031 TaxID=3085774 RepID=UPI00397B396F
VFPFFGALCDRISPLRLAGLLVGVFSGRAQTGWLIVVLSLAMGGIGAAVSIGAALWQRKRALALGES